MQAAAPGLLLLIAGCIARQPVCKLVLGVQQIEELGRGVHLARDELRRGGHRLDEREPREGLEEALEGESQQLVAPLHLTGDAGEMQARCRRDVGETCVPRR